jgi:hypothetical protein
MMFMMLAFFGMAFGLARTEPNGPPLVFMFVMWLFVAAMYAAMTIPSLIAGYGLLKRRKWAKTASVIAGVFAAMHFPVGSAVCVYTFWLVFSEPGRAIFDRGVHTLPAARQAWANEVRKEVQYSPPASPPDWR